MTTKIGIIGASGMLGSMMTQYFSKQPGFTVVAYVRDDDAVRAGQATVPEAQWIRGDFNQITGQLNFPALAQCRWILNAIGITKPLIKDDDPEQIARAIMVNGMLPHQLGLFAAAHDARVIQIATDCVYSGKKGHYTERDVHDAEDVYGKTKSLGETFLSSVAHLRCSIIGPESKDFRFLLEWFVRQPKGATLKGFVNHEWNGVTTLQFAKLCHGIIRETLVLPHIQHMVPAAPLSKASMLRVFAECYNRSDINIEEIEAPTVVHRTLATVDEQMNRRVWSAAGYSTPPTVAEMIKEVSQFDYKPLF